MSSCVNLTSGLGFERSGMIASGWVFGSRTTLAIRVLLQRAKTAGWQVLQAVEPAYEDVWENRLHGARNSSGRMSLILNFRIHTFIASDGSARGHRLSQLRDR